MSDAELVADFTKQTGHIVPDNPIPMKEPAVNFLIKMVCDELLELAATVYEPAEAKQIMTQMLVDAKEVPKVSDNPIVIAAEQVDACIDIYIYCLNACAKHGLNASKVFKLVHKANMDKKDPSTGKFIIRSDGKVLKPIGWKAPDINAEIARQIKEGAWLTNNLRISESGEWFNFDEKIKSRCIKDECEDTVSDYIEGVGYIEDMKLKAVYCAEEMREDYETEVQAMVESRDIKNKKIQELIDKYDIEIQELQNNYSNKIQTLENNYEETIMLIMQERENEIIKIQELLDKQTQ